MRISEVADRTGVPATTLRYYEDVGLLAPAERSPNGYRAYSERDVERLRFLTRAKRLDLTLDDLRELVTAWDGDRCDDVRDRMAAVLSGRLTQTRERLADLVALAAQLQAAATTLAAAPAHEGGCDEGCACAAATTGVPLTAAREPDIACTLDPGATRDRVGDWGSVLARATGRSPVPGGTALTFPLDGDLAAELARLAVAEHACCRFFDFTLHAGADGLRFEVRAPDAAQDVLAALFGR
jgi:DNA-binding transcriptional MerR regulator